jgi:hypothetical protein
MSILSATRGDTTIYRFSCVDVDGAPVDLAAAAITMDVRGHPDAGDALIEKALGDGLTVVPPSSAGLVDLELEPADTEGLDAGRYYWDLEVAMGDQAYTVDAGLLMLSADVTRAGS